MSTTDDGPQEALDRELARRLARRATEQGVELVGPGGLLGLLATQVLGTGLEAETSEHLGYDRHDRPARAVGTPATAPAPRR